MERENLTPEEGFDLIKDIIAMAREQFEANGAIYVFWGILIAFCSACQYILLTTGYTMNHWYPYLFMPLGGIYTFFYFYKKREHSVSNRVTRIISSKWFAVSLNIMIIAFIYSGIVKDHLIPFILIILSLAITISGFTLQINILKISGIIMNIAAYVSFSLHWTYHPLVMSITSIACILIPGILLIRSKRYSK